MVGLEDHPQLALGCLLSFQKPVPVTREGLDLREERRWDRQWAPVRVVEAERVGEHERVEPIVLDCGNLVTLSRPSGDPRGYGEHRMPGRLEMLDEQSFGAFDRNRDLRSEADQILVELAESGDIVTDTGLEQPLPVGRDNAELMVVTTPVDAGEHRPSPLDEVLHERFSFEDGFAS